ncbi:MAG: heme biosynthesis protein HemY, partial [Hyphomicrobiales bacterium]|nr:heme biosynthesis protein HemY [Hyphomicrobiales bacterium]
SHAAGRATFEGMLDDPDTRLLGLHGLFVEAQRAGDRTAARHYAERAANAAPSLVWAGEALFQYQSADGDWEGALRTLQRNTDNKLIDKAAARRQRAVLLTAQALELEDTDPERARSLALEAHGLAQDLVPAAVVAGRLYTQAGDVKRATKVIETTWKLMPHPDLAEVYAHARSGDSARDRLKRVKTLAQKRAHHVEGALAIAAAAIDARDWKEARDALGQILRTAPTARVCSLMAEIEQGEYGDRGRVREWLSRALRAPRDPVWTADGFVSDRWAPISPITGRIDAFEWKVPVEQLAGPAEIVIDDELVAPMVLVDASVDVPAAVDADAGSDATVAAAPQAPAPEQPVAEKPAATPEAAPAGEKPVAPAAAERTKEAKEAADGVVRFPLDHAPDDPGPEPDGDTGGKRFKLY